MTIKSILVPMTGDDVDRVCLDAAWMAAQPGQAHVTGLFGEVDVAAMPAIYGGDGVGFYLTDEFLAALTQRNDACRARATVVFEAWAHDHGVVLAAATGVVTGSFVATLSDQSETVRRWAVVNDLVVAALPGDTTPDRVDIFEAALFAAGKPVLAVPAGAGLPPVGGPAMIAWNGSAEAAGALTAALPLLAHAARIDVILAEGEEADPIIGFLGRHGLAAAATALPSGSGEVGPTLLAEADRRGVGLIVLGAYGHSRAREFVFGGVTRHLLHHAKVPLLIAH